MSIGPEQDINQAFYQWCVRAFTVLRRRLGINIKVHDDDGQMAAGQIFLFNHFTRFETIIPQYFIYQATGAYCRCVAAHEFFQGNERFAKLLWNCGAVPNDHPGLLPFLAAEILRGRKVIFFPEGKMIKDRRVVDDPGTATYSSTLPDARKHHKGAAALALTLEIFKRRILSVAEAGETQRLQRWVAALGVQDVDALIAAAQTPTNIVPANITFYPVHTSDNILRKAAEFFGQDLSEPAKEELLIESNLVLKRTDMDIRLGRPVDAEVSWTALDQLILGKVFEQIDSLDELFALKESANNWIERLVNMAMRRKIRRLRDLCMDEMYARVTVNLNHLASRLVLGLLDRSITDIDQAKFHRLLYFAFKKTQQEAAVHFHRSLTDPAVYSGIHDGSSDLIAQFLETPRMSGLIEVGSKRYKFDPALCNESAGRDPRLENIVAVYANEIAPVAAACRAVDRALDTKRPPSGPAMARLLFDDEMRAFTHAREAYSHSQHADINDRETATESGEPFLFVPKRPESLAVVLAHGYLASPAEVRAFGQRLADLGYPVIGVRLAGHGTSPWDLRDRSWQDWLASLRRGYDIMAEISNRICLIGFSSGGSLALHLAAERPAGLVATVAVAPPLKLRHRGLALVPVLHGINKMTKWATSQDGLMPFRVNDSEHPHINYRHIPIRSLFELRRVADELGPRLPEVSCPVQLIQGSDDPIVDPAGIQTIHDGLGSTEKALQIVQSHRHGILNENIDHTQEHILDFLQSLSAPASRPDTAESERGDASEAAAPESAATMRSDVPTPGSSDAEANEAGGVMPRPLAAILRPFRRSRSAGTPQAEPAYPWAKSYPADIDWQLSVAPRPLHELLDTAVRDYGERPCLNFRGKLYRYRAVGSLVDRAAKGFQELGVRRGIKVGLMLPNCPYAVICFYGVLKAGGTVVNINPLYSASEIKRQAADSGARMLVTLDLKGLYEKVSDLAHDSGPIETLVICRMKGVLRFAEKFVFDFFKSGEVATVPDDEHHLSFERLIANNGAVGPVTIDPLSDIAVLQYTGGTTGFPKGAQLTHANLYLNTAQLRQWATDIKLGEEKSLAVLPLFHSFGMTAVMNLSLWIGAEIVLLAKFQTAEVLTTINRVRPTIFIGVPSMYSALLAARDIAKYDLSSLRVCISGGAPLPMDLRRRFESLTGCTLVEGYGLSEASPVCTVNPLTGGKPGSVGLPLPGTVIEIVSLKDPRRVLSIGERGEVCISGPQVMTGYANRAKENVDIFIGGRLHTGDVGYLDKDGYLFIVDRIKELILSGGFNVYPRQVEEAIHLHPAVEEVAVCGVPDAHRGEIVKAFVKLREDSTATAADLRTFLNDKLAPFEMPRQIEFRDDLPKTLIGKVAKKELLAEEKAAAQTTEPTLGAEH